ncbi:MAG: peptidoglycan DD-metalloendopeptidase family protein [Bacteroidales bacterium]|jgi:murein DD-endopeptidase MepM/ murein hydrolase activator NlpD|nr:peptidoglycan DD-metalloendopeptidase family protein [Bacteroidales bacterium]
MKKKLFFLFISLFSFAQAQVTVSDISEHSQFNTTANDNPLSSGLADIDFSQANFVSANHQIPSYNLYDQEWSSTQLKSKDLNIPFSNGKLMVILVSEKNNPFIFPCRGQLSRNYGVQRRKEFHPGIDFALQANDQIYCCFDGVVRMAAEFGDYGKMVVIRHYNGLETVYARLGKVYVKPGQTLSAGHVIGTSGGENDKGTLHFETRFMNEYFNPEIMLDLESRNLYSNNIFLKKEDFNITKTSLQQPVKKENTSQSAQYHIVKKGETLYRISITYNVPIETLIKINNLPANGTILEGQKLKIQ